jgi:hypothetical protein
MNLLSMIFLIPRKSFVTATSLSVSIELVRLPTLSPLPSRRNRPCRSARSLHCITLVLKSVLPCNCAMRNIKSALGLAAAISLSLAAVALAADAKFRADGTIQRVSADMVLVRTSAQDIEIKRDAKTKITGQLRRGGAATVFYTKVAGENVASEIMMGGAAKPK